MKGVQMTIEQCAISKIDEQILHFESIKNLKKVFINSRAAALIIGITMNTLYKMRKKVILIQVTIPIYIGCKRWIVKVKRNIRIRRIQLYLIFTRF